MLDTRRRPTACCCLGWSCFAPQPAVAGAPAVATSHWISAGSNSATAHIVMYVKLSHAQAPSGLLLPGLELPYAAPFVPRPSLPPPEHLLGDPAQAPAWRPTRRRAVLVGINYTRAGEGGARLRGCVRDAHCLHGLLAARFGWADTAGHRA